MKLLNIPRLSASEALDNVVAQAEYLAKNAQWHSPYNGYTYNGRRVRSRLVNLRIALLQLKKARKSITPKAP